MIYTTQVSKSVPTPNEAGRVSQIRLIKENFVPSSISIFEALYPSIPARIR